LKNVNKNVAKSCNAVHLNGMKFKRNAIWYFLDGVKTEQWVVKLKESNGRMVCAMSRMTALPRLESS
jgi:hypothetical protein